MLNKTLTCVTAVLCLAGVQGRSQDWPQWRGPNRDGQIAHWSPPRTWPGKLTKGWQVEVGESFGSPIVVGDRVYLLTRDNDHEAVTCLRLDDGQEVWQQHYPAPYEVNPAAHEFGKAPRGTPCFADGRLFTLGVSGIFSAWDAERGQKLWRHRYEEEFQATSPLYGAAMSPLVVGENVIAHVGGHANGALVSCNVSTGEEAWRLAGDGPAYASPILVEDREGRPTIVTQTQSACIAVDAATGEELWRLPFGTEFVQNSITPVVTRDGLIVFGGYRMPTFAVRWRRDDAEQVWENAEVPFYMSTPVAVGDRLFGFTQANVGQLVALDAKGGAVLWEGPPRMGNNAALVTAGSLLIVLKTDARLLVYDTSKAQPKQLAEYTLADSKTWAHPVPVPGGFLIEDATTLARWSWE